MPEFLERKLRAQYGDNPAAIYGTMNKIGAMRGNKETAKGREMERKHKRDYGRDGEVRKHAKRHRKGRDHARDDDDDRGREERHRRGDYDDHSGKDENKTRGLKRKKGMKRKSTSRRHVMPKRPHEKKAFLSRLQEEGRESRSGDRE